MHTCLCNHVFLKESLIPLLLDALLIHSILNVGAHHGCGYWFNRSVQWTSHDTILDL